MIDVSVTSCLFTLHGLRANRCGCFLKSSNSKKKKSLRKYLQSNNTKPVTGNSCTFLPFWANLRFRFGVRF